MAVEYRVYIPYCCCAVCMAVEYRVYIPCCCCAVCMAVEYRVYIPYCCCAVCMAVEYRVECTPPTAVVRFVWQWSTELSVHPLLLLCGLYGFGVQS